MRICPADLWLLEEGKARLRTPADCWDCAACIKQCPTAAIKMYLAPELGGKGALLTARTLPGNTLWELQYPDGRRDRYLLPRVNVPAEARDAY